MKKLGLLFLIAAVVFSGMALAQDEEGPTIAYFNPLAANDYTKAVGEGHSQHP